MELVAVTGIVGCVAIVAIVFGRRFTSRIGGKDAEVRIGGDDQAT